MISRRQFLAGSIGGAVGWSALQFEDFDTLVPQLMRDSKVPGVSMAIVRGGRVTWHRAFGVADAASGRRVDDRTVFEAASVSKTVFAYAVMQLCDRGVLDLDTPLTKYTPVRILEGDPRLDLITARHVLSHTTGLQNFRSTAEPLRIQFTPGEKYLYSGEGYWYLQSVVTTLTGAVDGRTCGTYEADLKVCATDIGTYLGTNVLAPCGMTSSGYVWSDAFEKHAARPHDDTGRPLPVGKTSAVDAARYAAMGGLRTTATDYARFLIEVMAMRAAPHVRLRPATRNEMVRPQVTVDAAKSWGLGWEILHTPAGDRIQHQGGQRGAQAFGAASIEHQSGYAIFTNSDNGWKVFFDERFTRAIDRLVFS